MFIWHVLVQNGAQNFLTNIHSMSNKYPRIDELLFSKYLSASI